MRKLGRLGWIVFLILFIGGINWGLVGLFGFNLIEAVFGTNTLFTKIIYVLVGLSAIYMLAIVSLPPQDVYRSIGHDPSRQKPLNDRRRGDRRHPGDRTTEETEEDKDLRV